MQIIYRVRVKPAMVEAFHRLVNGVLAPHAHKLPGCQKFMFYQNTTDTQEFLFHEIWDNHESVTTYKKNLITILGDPHPGEEFPAKMNDMIEDDEDLV